MMLTAVGVDVAKRVFQLQWVEPETGEIISKQVKRAAFLEHFANRAPCLVGMEACGGAQHWGRRLTELGHQVRLMPGKAVKAFVGEHLRYSGIQALLHRSDRLSAGLQLRDGIKKTRWGLLTFSASC